MRRFRTQSPHKNRRFLRCLRGATPSQVLPPQGWIIQMLLISFQNFSDKISFFFKKKKRFLVYYLVSRSFEFLIDSSPLFANVPIFLLCLYHYYIISLHIHYKLPPPPSPNFFVQDYRLHFFGTIPVSLTLLSNHDPRVIFVGLATGPGYTCILNFSNRWVL